MSDNWVIFVPKAVRHLPDELHQKAALEVFQKFAPQAEEFEVQAYDHIQFFDCGSNLEKITCPNCNSTIDFNWWNETLAKDYEEESGFQMAEFEVPCCSSRLSLDALQYSFHQAFGRFALSAMNANIGFVSMEQQTKIEQALECGVSVVYQHI